MTDWSPPDPTTTSRLNSSDPTTVSKKSIGFAFRIWRDFTQYIGLFVAAIGFAYFLHILQLADESRTSLAANSRALDLFTSSEEALYFGVTVLVCWLLHMRRRLKKGVIKRFPLRWKRLIVGIFIPIILPIYWAQDIEQLSQIPRNLMASVDEIRSKNRTRNGYLWIFMFLMYANVSDKLGMANLGVDYVTVGPAGIDDPLRYALKFIDPSLITTNLDKYSKFIWPACLGGSLLVMAFGLSTWWFMRKITMQIKAGYQ
jgi:hypothetical protein